MLDFFLIPKSNISEIRTKIKLTYHVMICIMTITIANNKGRTELYLCCMAWTSI